MSIWFSIETALLCVLASIAVYKKSEAGMRTYPLKISYRHLIGFYILYLVTDVSGKILLSSTALLMQDIRMICAVLEKISVAGMLYALMMFTVTASEEELSKSIAFRAVSVMPFTFICALAIMSPTRGIIFSISGNVYNRGPLYTWYIALCLGYAVSALLVSITKARYSNFRTKKHWFIGLSIVTVIPMHAVIFDYIVPETPMLSMSMQLLILWLYTKAQESTLFIDSLTDMYNRKRADIYLEERFAKGKKPAYIYIFVIDGIKNTNRNYGFDEGDRVIHAVSRAMKMAADRYGCFVARYRGDEFIAVVNKNSADKKSFHKYVEKSLRYIASGMNCEVHVKSARLLCDDKCSESIAIKKIEKVLRNRNKKERLREYRALSA